MYTPEQEEEYVANDGQFCPVCKSGNIEGEEFEAQSGSAVQKIRCMNCGARWLDVYHLVGIQEIEKGE